LAKTIVAAGLADRCAIQLSYSIFVSKPFSIYVDTYDTGKVPESEISKIISNVMDLTPRGIIDHLQLRKPIYQRTAAYEYFGRTPD
jgi:S-adenosylmethionine synthetase